MAEASVATPVSAASPAASASASGDVTPSGGTPAGGESPADKQAAAIAADDPDFEFEVEEADEKGAKIKKATKIKSSEAKAKLSRLSALEAEHLGGRKQLQKYYQEQIVPLQQEIEEAKKDPRKLISFAKKLGLDFDSAALEFAKEQVELGKLTPEQIEAKRTAEELQRYRDMEKSQTEQKQQQERQAQVLQQSEKLQVSIVEAATKVGLPKDPSVMMIMTGYMRNQINQGGQPDAQEAAQYAQNVFQGGLKQALTSMTYDQLEKNYPELLTKVREGDIKKVRGTVPKPSNTPRARAQDPKPTRTFMSPEEYQAKMERGE